MRLEQAQCRHGLALSFQARAHIRLQGWQGCPYQQCGARPEWAAPNHRDRATQFEAVIQKELFATANAALSLVNHTRRLIKLNSLPAYNAKRGEAFGQDGLHEFVTGLRILLHHLHIVEAGWTISGGSRDRAPSATFMLDRAELQRLIEEHRDGFGAQHRLHDTLPRRPSRGYGNNGDFWARIPVSAPHE